MATNLYGNIKIDPPVGNLQYITKYFNYQK